MRSWQLFTLQNSDMKKLKNKIKKNIVLIMFLLGVFTSSLIISSIDSTNFDIRGWFSKSLIDFKAFDIIIILLFNHWFLKDE